MADNSFDARSDLEVGGRSFEIYRLDALQSKYDVARLPFSLKVLLENLLRNEDGVSVRKEDIEALASWDHNAEPSKEIAFTPARVVLQDFTGVPCVVDLAAMRDAMADLGGDPAKINPLVPVELVIDHSVQVDVFGTRDAFRINAEKEFERNKERYAFLRWGQGAFEGFKAVPPDTGIVHQVNLEYLSRVVFTSDETAHDGPVQAYPDTLVGTDSHTTMINGLGVLGWGVGGIEAEAAMLGQAMSMLIPRVVGFKLHGELHEGATATDLVLTVTQMLREHGVVSKFVEFFGPGVPNLPLADRATIGNMSPEFGSTCAIFPIDAETLRYLEFSGRPKERIELVEAYAREQGLWHDEDSEEPTYSETLELDLGDVVPSLAGPKRPQDRVSLTESKASFRMALDGFLPDEDDDDEAVEESFPASDPPAFHDHPHARQESGAGTGGAQVADRVEAVSQVTLADGTETELDHGHVVIAAITSCTNTSNPSVMIGAGLLAKSAVERGLEVKPWVKTSLAPGSKVVMEYYERAGPDPVPRGARLPPRGLRLHDLHRELRPAARGDLRRGQRRGPRGRLRAQRQPQLRGPHQPRREDELPRLAAAVRGLRAGGDDGHRPARRAAGHRQGRRGRLPEGHLAERRGGRQDRGARRAGRHVHEAPTRTSSRATSAGTRSTCRRATASRGTEDSTYVRRPPFFDDLSPEPEAIEDIEGARVLAVLGDSVTTDHISPAGAIKKDSPAAKYLNEHGVENKDFNSYGARRGNHEVMMRGTFANIRLRNTIAGEELVGGLTKKLPDGEELPIYDAAMKYAEEGTPLVVLAGKEYGSGSSRDWAAKGTNLLGVRAVIAQSFERIHRSNLVGMGVLPLQFAEGDSAESLGLTGEEEFTVTGLDGGDAEEVTVRAGDKEFTARVRIDTPKEREYYKHGGILQFVLRQLLAAG